MFEPDTLLPEQFFSILGRKPLQGEKRLPLGYARGCRSLFPDLPVGPEAA